jgi:serine/threonine protein kinase/Tfp pilus assembly protein PilF
MDSYMPDEDDQQEQTQFFVALGPGVKIGHYEIVERIGAGGMGEVFLADDTKLDRRIALKFLPPNIADDKDFKARFVREARSAAALNHPNIITIHEISEWEGRLFIAMEYVEGQSLSDIIKSGQLTYETALGLAAQVCSGLARAHKSGVIHRDIKADNVLVDSEGHAKILDFGLAKGEGDVQLTQAGTAMGTVNYMSPEQAQGLEVDHRSDIFSVGVLIYQMLTGNLPFQRNNMPATLYAVVHDQPEPLSSSVPDAPPELQQVVDAALAKRPADRYQKIDDLGSDIRSLLGQPQTTQVTLTRSHTIAPAVKSLAVLYLRNLGGEEDEFLSYGITEDLIVDLSRLGTIRVASMRSILKFKDSEEELEAIAAGLGVGIVLDGSIHKSGDSIRVSVQLVDVGTGSNLWADRWQETAANLPNIKKALAESISRALNMDSSAVAAVQVVTHKSEDPQAYEFYLRGKYAFNNKKNSSDIEVALGLYRQALALEPSLLAARAGVAEILIQKGEYQGAQAELDGAVSDARARGLKADEGALMRLQARSHVRQSSWSEAMKLAEQAAAIAVEGNDPVSEADALSIQIDILSRRAKFDEALRLFERVLEINKKLDNQKRTAEALKNMGTVYLRKGDYERARSLYQQALDMARKRNDSALEADCTGNIGLTYYHTSESDKALQFYQDALAIHSQLGDKAREALWMNNIALVYESRGSYRLALEYFEKVSRIDQEMGDGSKYALSHSNAATMLATLGEYRKAIKYAHESLSIVRSLDYPLVEASANDTLASAHFYRGEIDLAAEYFEEALEVAEESGLPLNLAHSHANLGELYYIQGQGDRCRQRMESARKLADEIGHREVALKTSAYLNALISLQGNRAEGISQLREVVEKADQHGDPRLILIAKRLLGQVLLNAESDANEVSEARDILSQARTLAEQTEIAHEVKWITDLQS